MEIEVKFFANFRELVGQKRILVSANTVRELLENLRDGYEGLRKELFVDEENVALKESVNVTVNGRRIEMLDGIDTELRDKDTIAIFPPVAGG
ncbi:hypothetical protein AKJ45_02160 [candidate division MSBL1 archaeon SCGC-AAA261F19]|uniref:Uncharacterized protein n=1 Tax=candidate division MSBL1 archaeon SCGC-AAA261F19 TaxID=1698275 RepID=A0A133V9Y7_9EURY|nr:hypothetical protein AKJ45_02160 [candidate division MSBL1 archaeon SCGC-AAA261F19]